MNMNIQELHERAMSDAAALVTARLDYADALRRVRSAPIGGVAYRAAAAAAKAALKTQDAAYHAANASAAACCAAVPVGSSMGAALRA